MAANSEVKHKSETMLEVIRGLVLHFVVNVVTVWRNTVLYDFSTECNIRYMIHHLMSTKC